MILFNMNDTQPGASEKVGRHFIDACNGDLEMAIGMHMDSGGLVPALPNDNGVAGASSPSKSSTSSVAAVLIIFFLSNHLIVRCYVLLTILYLAISFF